VAPLHPQVIACVVTILQVVLGGIRDGTVLRSLEEDLAPIFVVCEVYTTGIAPRFPLSPTLALAVFPVAAISVLGSCFLRFCGYTLHCFLNHLLYII